MHELPNRHTFNAEHVRNVRRCVCANAYSSGGVYIRQFAARKLARFDGAKSFREMVGHFLFGS